MRNRNMLRSANNFSVLSILTINVLTLILCESQVHVLVKQRCIFVSFLFYTKFDIRTRQSVGLQ